MKKTFTLLLFAAAFLLCPILEAQKLPDLISDPVFRTAIERVRKVSPAENARFATTQTIRVAQTETQASWGDNNQWQDELRTAYTYNNRGHWETATEVELPSGANTTQYTFSYNSQGIPTEIVIKEWENNAWVNTSKLSFEFDGNTLHSFGMYVWFNNTWLLMLGERSTSTLTNGRTTETVFEIYSAIPGASTQGWVQSERITYSYAGSDNRPTGTISYSWNGGAWVAAEKMTNIVYVSSTTDRSSFILEELNSSTNTWDKYRYEYQYITDAANKTRTVVETEFNIEGTAAIPSLRTTTTELTSGETYISDTVIRRLEEVYNGQAWVRDAEAKATVTREANGDIIQIVWQEFSDGANAFVNTERFTYSNFATITITGGADDVLAQATEVYPNPVQHTLRISLDAAKVRNASLSIYSLTGQKVYEQERLGATATVDVSNLPAGVYLVKIADDRNANITRRIVKQ